MVVEYSNQASNLLKNRQNSFSYSVNPNLTLTTASRNHSEDNLSLSTTSSSAAIITDNLSGNFIRDDDEEEVEKGFICRGAYPSEGIAATSAGLVEL